MGRLTKKLLESNENLQYIYIDPSDKTDFSILNKLGKLEDIEEEIGFEKSGSSLLAFLDTPYIKSIMKLYVSARKELEN